MPDVTAPKLVEAWQGFHAAQQEVLGWMTDSPRFQQWPQHRAKAYHTLMEALAMAYNFAVAPRMEQPRVQVNSGWFADMYTLGQNGPDLFYAVIFLDGAQEYRLTGNVGDSRLILAQVIRHLSGHPDSVVLGNHDFSDFMIAPDGSFDITFSAQPKSGNWIPLAPECSRHFILIRRFMNHPGDTAPVMRLERTSPIADGHYDAEEFDENVMADRIESATAFLRYLIKDFNLALFDSYCRVGGGYNNMAFLPGTVTSQVGSPSSNYAMAVFDLADDEALIVELNPAPDGVYWGFQLGDVWSRSLNFTPSPVLSQHAFRGHRSGRRLPGRDRTPRSRGRELARHDRSTAGNLRVSATTTRPDSRCRPPGRSRSPNLSGCYRRPPPRSHPVNDLPCWKPGGRAISSFMENRDV